MLYQSHPWDEHLLQIMIYSETYIGKKSQPCYDVMADFHSFPLNVGAIETIFRQKIQLILKECIFQIFLSKILLFKSKRMIYSLDKIFDFYLRFVFVS